MVQERRETIGRSVEEAARLAGMESSEWAAVESGHIPADPDRLRSMAAALEVRFDDLAPAGLSLPGGLGGLNGLASILITR